MAEQVQPSICILRLSALGDCINAFGVANALNSINKDLDILWIIDSRFSSLFKDQWGHPLVNLYEVNLKKVGLLKAVLQLRKDLHNKHFDFLLNMQTSIKSSLLSTAIKAKYKYGYNDERSREGHRLFINRKIDMPSGPHVLDGFLSFAKSIGFNDIIPKWDFRLSFDELTAAKSLLNNFAETKILSIAPGSAKVEKNWTVEGYSCIADYAQSKGFSIVLLGGNNKTELELCQNIEKNIKNNCINLCGKTSLRTLAAILSLSKLVISPDSASMHLASALNIPVIGLFAIHSPLRVGAYNFKDLQVSVYEQCAQLELNTSRIPWRYRVKDKNAMTKIQKDDVIKTLNYACKKYYL